MLTTSSVQKKHLIVVGGPTAVGKTDLAIDLANYWGTEILSADSRQIYKELNIGTAKPTAAQLAKVKHHFINELSITTIFTAADFESQSLARLSELFTKHQVVICTGGTGLYIRALVSGFDHIPSVDANILVKLQHDLDNLGLAVLARELRQADPVYAEQADLHNPHRVMRALSVCRQTNNPFSFYLSGQQKTRDFKITLVCLMRDREELYSKIEMRVDDMMRQGLEEEARSLLPYKHEQALQTVGYKELFDFFDGKIQRERAVELIKQNSRRYAKRQLTWFRNQGEWNFVDVKDANSKDYIIKLIGDDL